MNESKLSCGIVLARRTDEGWLTLMLRAFHHWDFPKGIRERGEEPLQVGVILERVDAGSVAPFHFVTHHKRHLEPFAAGQRRRTLHRAHHHSDGGGCRRHGHTVTTNQSHTVVHVASGVHRGQNSSGHETSADAAMAFLMTSFKTKGTLREIFHFNMGF